MSGSGPPAKKAKKQYDFDSKWLEDDDLKLWLQADPGDASKAVCLLCHASLFADEEVLKRHSRSRAHVRKVPPRVLTPEEEQKEKEQCMRDFIKKSKWSSCAADHWVRMMADILPDSAVAQGMLATHERNELFTEPNNNPCHRFMCTTCKNRSSQKW